MVVTARRLRLRVARSRCRGRPGAIEGDLPGTDLQPACGTRRAVLKVTPLSLAAGSGSLTVTVTVTV